MFCSLRAEGPFFGIGYTEILLIFKSILIIHNVETAPDSKEASGHGALLATAREAMD